MHSVLKILLLLLLLTAFTGLYIADIFTDSCDIYYADSCEDDVDESDSAKYKNSKKSEDCALTQHSSKTMLDIWTFVDPYKFSKYKIICFDIHVVPIRLAL